MSERTVPEMVADITERCNDMVVRERLWQQRAQEAIADWRFHTGLCPECVDEGGDNWRLCYVGHALFDCLEASVASTPPWVIMAR